MARHLRHLTEGEIEGSLRFSGGWAAANDALVKFNVEGYAASKDEVTPQRKRSASALSPYLRHGLLSQREVWDSVAGGPQVDVEQFHESLLWQEYARHWYSRLGQLSRTGTLRELAPAEIEPTWNKEMACLELTVEELEEEGWMVGRSRSWLASYWTTTGGSWRQGEEFFFRHLLDGSRAANRLGWQTAAGLTGSKPFHFNRWQVEKWAAGLCATCEVVRDCPIETPAREFDYLTSDMPIEAQVGTDILASAGPPVVDRRAKADVVWLTGESLGPTDPALVANPGLPAIFVLDEPLLAKIMISPKRLVFLIETLAEIARNRSLEIWLGRPDEVLAGYRVAVTYAPVPGFRRLSSVIRPAQVHPWPWLIEPSTGSVATFREWRRSVGATVPASLALSRPRA